MPNNTQQDGLYTFAGNNYKKVKGNWYKETNEDTGNYMPIKKGNVASRIATLEKNAQAYKNIPHINPLNLEPIQLSNNTILGDMMNIPQNIAVSALTGNKYTTPSDYLKGEKITDNPYVGAAADLVLDPMNLLLMKSISPYDKITPAYNKAVKWNKVVEPTIKFDLLTKPTTIEHANGGFVNPKGWPPPTSKGVSISDPKEYAYRKAAYNDSLAEYNNAIKYTLKSENDTGPFGKSKSNYNKTRYVPYSEAKKSIPKNTSFEYMDRNVPFTESEAINMWKKGKGLRASDAKETYDKDLFFKKNKIKPIGFDVYHDPKINKIIYASVFKKPVQSIYKANIKPTSDLKEYTENEISLKTKPLQEINLK